MTLPPEPKLRACLKVLYHAAIHCRMLGLQGHASGLTAEQAERVADIMDAVHNIPDLITRWDTCDESLLRGMLGDCDARSETGLLVVYDRVAAGTE